MKKVIFLGAKNIGASCFEYLIENKNLLQIEIIGVLTNKRGGKILELAKNNSIKILNSLDDYLMLKTVDLAVSVQYHEILKKRHLSIAKFGTFNLHMAPMPEYRGCNQFSFAIINNEQEFGTSIHLMDEGIDSGQLFFEKRFKIPDDIWVEDLFKLTEFHSLELFKKSIKDIIDQNLQPLKLARSCKSYFYLRKDINSIKKINLDWSPERISRHIRATTMPGFPGPYFEIDGKILTIKLDTYL